MCLVAISNSSCSPKLPLCHGPAAAFHLFSLLKARAASEAGPGGHVNPRWLEGGLFRAAPVSGDAARCFRSHSAGVTAVRLVWIPSVSSTRCGRAHSQPPAALAPATCNGFPAGRCCSPGAAGSRVLPRVQPQGRVP